MYKNEVKKIVNEVYPLIKQYYGKSKFNSKAPKINYHHNIFARITGIAEAEGDYLTYISRIKKDNSNKKAINLWVVSDNLLKGAALNTVQIAQCLMKKN